MTEKASRYNEGKPQLSYLLDFDRALDALVKVCEQGAIKYEELNWKKGGKPDREYIDSCLRHVKAYQNGEVYDKDMGTIHIANAAWNLLAMLELNVCSQPEIQVLNPEFDQQTFVNRYNRDDDKW